MIIKRNNYLDIQSQQKRILKQKLNENQFLLNLLIVKDIFGF